MDEAGDSGGVGLWISSGMTGVGDCEVGRAACGGMAGGGGEEERLKKRSSIVGGEIEGEVRVDVRILEATTMCSSLWKYKEVQVF